MSGCYPSETLSVCGHGVPVKFGCCQCVNENQKVEETITIKKALWDEMIAYKKKIDELHKRIQDLELLVHCMKGFLNT